MSRVPHPVPAEKLLLEVHRQRMEHGVEEKVRASARARVSCGGGHVCVCVRVCICVYLCIVCVMWGGTAFITHAMLCHNEWLIHLLGWWGCL